MTTTTNKFQVAETILAQLGGNRFIAMTGAKDFLGDASALHFRIPRNRTKANRVTITLQADDTYSIEWFSVRGFDKIVKRSFDGIYADQLRRLWESETGLLTSL